MSQAVSRPAPKRCVAAGSESATKERDPGTDPPPSLRSAASGDRLFEVLAHDERDARADRVVIADRVITDRRPDGETALSVGPARYVSRVSAGLVPAPPFAHRQLVVRA